MKHQDGTTAVTEEPSRADHGAGAGDDLLAEHEPSRQQVSLAFGLRAAVAGQRDRIEQAMPAHRRRSIENYLDLAVRLGLERLAEVQPIIDPLAGLGEGVQP